MTMLQKNFHQPSTINPQPESPSTLIPHPSTFIFPPSIQSDLFNYLKDEQKEFIKPILRVLKKPAQEELCCMLLDYMETGEVIMSNDVVVGGMFNYLTRYNMPEFPALEKKIIRPLHYRSQAPQKTCGERVESIGEIINRFFPQLKKSLRSAGTDACQSKNQTLY